MIIRFGLGVGDAGHGDGIAAFDLSQTAYPEIIKSADGIVDRLRQFLFPISASKHRPPPFAKAPGGAGHNQNGILLSGVCLCARIPLVYTRGWSLPWTRRMVET